MSNDGPSAYGLEAQGFRNLKAVHWNLAAPRLYEIAVGRGEGQVAEHGPLVVLTGQHTGRSASDKFIVRDAASEPNVWWDNNLAMEPAACPLRHRICLALSVREPASHSAGCKTAEGISARVHDHRSTGLPGRSQ